MRKKNEIVRTREEFPIPRNDRVGEQRVVDVETRVASRDKHI